MYELFVLGELLNNPMHGYVLHQVISEAIGPIRKMSWSALYPLLRQLERNGLIIREDAPTEGGRERKRYLITPAGEARFRALMLEPGDYNTDYPDLFTLKMGKFQHLTIAEQIHILRHYRGYVEFIQKSVVESQKHVANEIHVPDEERPYLLRSLDHRLHLTNADLQWLDSEIARLENEQTNR